MTENEIKTTRKNLITPIVVYIVLFIIAISFNRLGSKRPTPQTVSLFASAFCLTFIIFSWVKLYKFNKFINNN